MKGRKGRRIATTIKGILLVCALQDGGGEKKGKASLFPQKERKSLHVRLVGAKVENRNRPLGEKKERSFSLEKGRGERVAGKTVTVMWEGGAPISTP